MTVRWGLTGSFTSNGLEDVFGQCKIVDQSLLGRAKGAFMQQYFVEDRRPDFSEWTPRPGALEMVMKRIKPATFVLEPGEYKDKLPPLHTVEVACKMDMAGYNKMKKDFVLDDVVAVNAAVVTQKLQQMSSGFLYSDNGPIWLSPHKFDRLEELLDENQHANTIIFYSYQEELAELRRRYPYLQTLDEPNAIERWNRGEIELLVAHPASAQFGLNLQFGGNKMVFLSLPWSLTDFEQAIGRLHRSGQTNDVWVYLMITEKTIDAKILDALANKRSVAEIALEALK
jgi:SNF2 family DNA or RNA helicase